MKRFIGISVLVIVAVGIIWKGGLFSQESGEHDKMMEMIMKYGTPGENHTRLEPYVGSWTAVTKWWMDPGAEPQESKATAEAEWILGGRFVQEYVTGDMMGQPFHGFSITGHDNFRGEFISLWTDEMSTAFLVMRGTSTDGGKTITYSGTYDDIMTGQRDKKFKGVSKVIDNDSRIYQSFDYDPDGKEFMSMEVTYRRIK